MWERHWARGFMTGVTSDNSIVAGALQEAPRDPVRLDIRYLH
jgi:hypothetical protein